MELGTEPWFRATFARIAAWMSAHDAPLLVENLAPGASADRLDSGATELGSELPAHLRAMWSVHDGQIEEGNGFIESYDLLSIAGAVAQQETVRMLLQMERDQPSDDAEYTAEELRSDAWIPFAARDSDSLVVHGVSGRVFEYMHDYELTLLASSLGEWMADYTARVEAGDYVVEEGFGDYYLERRDREEERRKEELQRRRAEQERYRRDTPLLDQLAAALEQRDADRCLDVFRDALARDRGTFDAAVAQLFASNPTPELAAAALRPSLNAATLTPDQWVDIAVGGALLENNAIRNYAIPRCAGASDIRLARLASDVRTADARRRPMLERLLADLGASTPAKEPSGWLSRLFGKRPPKS